MTDEQDRRPVDTEVPEEDEPTEAQTLDRGLAPPSVDPEITSTHPLDRGLAPPDDEETVGDGE
jgi:hypothetical protein